MTPQHNDKTIAELREELSKGMIENPRCFLDGFDIADKLHREAAQGLIEYMDNLGVGEEIIEAYRKKIGAP